MSNMKTPESVIRRIISDLEAGYNHRQTASRNGVSTMTVHNVRHKRKVDCPVKGRLAKPEYLDAVKSTKDLKRIKGKAFSIICKYAKPDEDKWDIFNTLWLYGNMQRCPDYAIWKCVRNGIKEYRTRLHGLHSEATHRVTKMISIESFKLKDGSDYIFDYTGRNGFEFVDFIDEVDAMTWYLPKSERLSLILRNLEGLEWGEIGSSIGCHSETARRLCHKAISKIKQNYKRC